ncbi:unnamed protein product [Effrenium voratum]|nr:unnamed protein product [Effrenium voratum]
MAEAQQFRPREFPQAPKSREERLRDFYAERTSALERSSPLQLQKKPDSEANEEAAQLRKGANDLYERQDYEGAVEQYTAAIKKAPSSVLHSNRAAAYMMLGWWQQALRDTKAALRKDSENLKALERQGRVQLALDQLEPALATAMDLEQRGPKEVFNGMERPALSIRRLRWLAEVAREPSSLEQVRELLEHFSSKAELVSPLGMRLRKKLVEVLVERSDTIDHQRRIRPALAYNQRAVERAGGIQDDEIEELTPFAEEALRITGELLQDFPDDADARYWRGRALLRLGRHADAEGQFEEGLRQDSGNEPIKQLQQTVDKLEELKQRANAKYKEGLLDEAIQLYSAGINCDPDCVDTRTVATLYYNRSAALRKKGEFEQALDDANMCLALHPKWTKALYRRGILLLECGRYAEALTELKVVQRADPTFDDDLEDWLRRAHCWLAKPKHTRNYYQLMKLPMDASKDDIRKQYRRLCLLWHPDKSDGSDRQRFEELQAAHRFLTDDPQKEEYDFGIWKDRPVRHHTKKRDKVKDSWNEDKVKEEAADTTPRHHYNWGDRHLIEDEKVESIYWGEAGCPAWLKEKRKEFQKKQFGQDYVAP